MKVIMVAVISSDEFLTRGSDSSISRWTSVQDKQFFADIKSEHSLLIMGRKTYESVTIKPEPGVLRLVMTRNPDRQKDSEINGQLEFTNLSASKIVQKYQKTYNSCLILGGGKIYEEFLKNNLVDEIYLTVEPITHGSGTPLLGSGRKLSDAIGEVKPETKILNSEGTKLLHYVIV